MTFSQECALSKISVSVGELARKVFTLSCYVWSGSKGMANALGRESVATPRIAQVHPTGKDIRRWIGEISGDT